MNTTLDSHTLLIADVHLQADDSHPINQAFHDFLIHQAPKADTLYILGDLFEIWVGDDIGLDVYQKTIQLLKQLTSNGLDIYLLYGNRDFLMRDNFWQATGIKTIIEPKKISMYGLEILVMHGDALCTDDIKHQKMRKILLNPLSTWLFLRLPKSQRIKIGKKMRTKSRLDSPNKAENIIDVTQSAVENLFKQHPNCLHLIHGHTHQPEHHTFQKDKKQYNRWVLGDWRPDAKIIKISPQQKIELINYPC